MCQMENPDEPRWYALNVMGNKVFPLRDKFSEEGIECFTPEAERRVSRGGRMIMKRVPAVPRLLFVRLPAAQLLQLEKQSEVAFRIYRTLESDRLKRRLIEIPEKRMRMFIAVAGSGEEGLEYLPCDMQRLSTCRKVRIIHGPLAGMEGYIKRIKGNRRFVVEVEGVCMVATHYIPAPFLTPID